MMKHPRRQHVVHLSHCRYFTKLDASTNRALNVAGPVVVLLPVASES